MKVMLVNGSPRKDWNTATLLQKCSEGAASKGARTELIHLYDLDYKGCRSCFSCKTIGGQYYGICSQTDDITPILERIKDADAVILGSPVYLGALTGAMRSFIERMVFPYLVYDGITSLFAQKINTGFIYTMNISRSDLDSGRFGLDKHIAYTEGLLKRIFGASESLIVTDTCQFDDYSKVYAPIFNAEHKIKRRREVFPIDCRKAFEMGERFAAK